MSRSPAASSPAAFSFTATYQSGKCIADIPAGAKAMLHLLVDLAGKESRARAAINGKSATLAIVRAPAMPACPRPIQELPQGTWADTRLDLPVGRTDVSVVLEFAGPPASFGRKSAGGSVLNCRLAEGELALEFRDPLRAAQAQPLPLPLSMTIRRETLTVVGLR